MARPRLLRVGPGILCPVQSNAAEQTDRKIRHSAPDDDLKYFLFDKLKNSRAKDPWRRRKEVARYRGPLLSSGVTQQRALSIALSSGVAQPAIRQLGRPARAFKLGACNNSYTWQ